MSMRAGCASISARSALFAACVTVAATVGLDVAAGEHLSHVLLLGGLATTVALLRVLLAGRYHGLFAVLSGALVVQPALHLAAAVVGPLATDAPLNPAHLVGRDLPLTIGQLLTAGLLVTAVASSERAFLLAATVLSGIVYVLVPPSPSTRTATALPHSAPPRLHDSLCPRHHGRRAPPTACVPVLL